MKRTYSFTQLLFGAFLLTILIVLTGALVMESLVFDNTFGRYLEDQTISEDLDWVMFIETSFDTSTDPSFDLQRAAMMNGLSFSFLDFDGNIVGVIDSGSMGMGHMKRDSVTMIERDYPLTTGPFSAIRIGRPESSILSLPEANFRSSLNRGYLLIGLFGLILAGGLAYWFSKKVSRPILSLEQYADSITQQNWNSTQDAGSSIEEIDSLYSSLINLSRRLQAQDRLRRRLTTNMSHELRTPLNILLNQMEAIHDGVLPLTEARSASLIQEIHRLSRLIDQIEGLNDLESQKDENSHHFDLSIVLKELAEAYQPLYRNKEISFNSDYPSPIMLESQEDAVRQILFNLLENALRYTPAHGSVLLKAEILPDRIQVIIEDSGIGIPESSLPHIFDRFYRVDPARAKDTGGTGLGLSIVKELVTLLKGTVTCQSQLGQGTRFVIQLPLH